MCCVRVQSPVTLPVDLHVHHPGVYEIRRIGAGGNHTSSICRSRRHGDCVHSDVQEPWRAPYAYCPCWNCYSLPASSIFALLLWREDQGRQQADKHDVTGLKMTPS